MSTGRSADVAARARAEMRLLEVPDPRGWDAGGDGVVVMTRDEMEALRKWCGFGDNIRALMVAAVRGWARRVPPVHRKRRIIDWLIEREARNWEEAVREVEAEEAADARAHARWLTHDELNNKTSSSSSSGPPRRWASPSQSCRSGTPSGTSIGPPETPSE
jgi:hypothetical protein